MARSLNVQTFLTRPSAALLLLGSLACGDTITAPLTGKVRDSRPRTKDPVLAAVRPFLFVSTESGSPQIYRFRGDTITRMTFSGMPDVNPHVAGAQAVFASYRDGNGEIYLGDSELRNVRRLTHTDGVDDEPSLSPAGDQIAYISVRNGTSRIYVMDTAGLNQRSLETGSPLNVPETRPTWSPSADRIAFASSRSGTSQIFVVPASGGEAVRLTNESVGAFDPTFTPDGTQIIYTAWVWSARLRVITLATGVVSDYATTSAASTGEATCNVDGCLATENPYGHSGDIVHVAKDGTRRTVISKIGNDFRPAQLDR